MAKQKRKQALEERNNRIKDVEMSTQDDDDGALDRLINALRDSGSVKRRRPRPLEDNTSFTSDPNETYNAKDMLEQLKAGGFMTTPVSPTGAPTPSQLRRLRRRTERGLGSDLLELSPLLVLDDESTSDGATEANEDESDEEMEPN